MHLSLGEPDRLIPGRGRSMRNLAVWIHMIVFALIYYDNVPSLLSSQPKTPRNMPSTTDLVITQAKVIDKTIVLEHIIPKRNDTGLVFEVIVAFKETLVELNDLSNGRVLPWGAVKTSSSLYDLEYHIARELAIVC